MNPPFDKPQSFIKLFSGTQQKAFIQLVDRIKENALLASAKEPETVLDDVTAS